MTTKHHRRARIKKRFIFITAILTIIGVVVIDRVLKYVEHRREQEVMEKYQDALGNADSTIRLIDAKGNEIQKFLELSSEDKNKVDSLERVLQKEDSLNEAEKQALIKEIEDIKNRVVVETVVMDMLEMDDTTHEAVTIVDTNYIDTVVFNYIYIDSVIYQYDTIIKIDTVEIKDDKNVKKIIKKYGK